MSDSFSSWIHRHVRRLGRRSVGCILFATPFSGSATRCPTGIPTKDEMTRAGGPVCKAEPVSRPLRILMYDWVCKWAWECSSCRMMARIGEPEVSQLPHYSGNFWSSLRIRFFLALSSTPFASEDEVLKMHKSKYYWKFQINSWIRYYSNYIIIG